MRRSFRSLIIVNKHYYFIRLFIKEKMKFFKKLFGLFLVTMLCCSSLLSKELRGKDDKKNDKEKNDSSGDKSKAALTFESGASKAVLLSNVPKRFVSSPPLSNIFSINLKVDKLSQGGKIFVGVINTNNRGKIDDKEGVEEWYISSVADMNDAVRSHEKTTIKEGDIITVFGNNKKVSFKINNNEYNYEHKLDENKSLRFAVKLFNKGDTISILNYSSTEMKFSKDAKSLIPAVMKNLLGKITLVKKGDHEDLDKGKTKINDPDAPN